MAPSPKVQGPGSGPVSTYASPRGRGQTLAQAPGRYARSARPALTRSVWARGLEPETGRERGPRSVCQ